MSVAPEGLRIPRRRRVPDPVAVYELGHWEAMQLALALDARATRLAEEGDTDRAAAVQAMANVLGQPGTFTILHRTEGA